MTWTVSRIGTQDNMLWHIYSQSFSFRNWKIIFSILKDFIDYDCKMPPGKRDIQQQSAIVYQ